MCFLQNHIDQRQKVIKNIPERKESTHGRSYTDLKTEFSRDPVSQLFNN